MQRKKIVVMCTALVLASLALPIANLPRAHAVVPGIISLSGLGVNGFQDPLTGSTVDGISAGSTLTVTAALLAPSTPSSGIGSQHNVTVGFKGTWMNQYQNATNAGPASTLTLTASQTASVTISIMVPSTGGLTAYDWTAIICDGPANAKTTACSFYGRGGSLHLIAVYTSDQLAAAQASNQASTTISYVSNAVDLAAGHPGATAANGQIAQAKTEMILGTQSWQTGDYGGARTHYQNALNDANAAASSLTSQGGGVDTASLVNLVLGGTGIALIGVGALLAGLGAFVHYIRKPKP